MTRRNGLLQFVIAALLLLTALFAYRFLIANNLYGPFLPYQRLINWTLLIIAGVGMLGFLSLLTGSRWIDLRQTSRGLTGWQRVRWILGILLVPIVFTGTMVVVYFFVMGI